MISNPPNFRIGDQEITGDLVLAPMDGYTDWPFRSICRELGSAISYTEFVKAEDVLQRPDYLKDKLYFSEAERPVFFQIYGHEPKNILEAALRLQEKGPDAIDINMGCPNRSIAGRGAGAGLMRTPKKVARIMKSLVKALDIPITAKIRTGWKDCQNGVLLAQIVEKYGGSLLAVHARSKEQGHQGAPDLPALAEIKKKLNIPVLGNGGILNKNDIQAMKDTTLCDGVMIGRGAVENPWIFSGRNREDIPPHEVQIVLLDHLERSLSFYGMENGLVLFRKFAAGYLKPYDWSQDERRKLLTETDPHRFRKLIQLFFQKLEQ
jgi:tRNA-dihydrouridine synthase B